MNPVSKDLLLKMIEKDPQKRISASEALKHPFITEKDLFSREEEIVPFDSPANINVNKER